MDKREALNLLDNKLREYRAQSYATLKARLVGVDAGEIVGASGVRYRYEIQVFWDSRRHDNIRVLGCIDDGGLSAFKPLCSDFIVAPDGSFIGES